MPLEAKFAPRPAKVAGRVYPSDHPRVNCAFSGVLSAATTVAGLCRSSSPPRRRASPGELDSRFRGDLSLRFVSGWPQPLTVGRCNHSLMGLERSGDADQVGSRLATFRDSRQSVDRAIFADGNGIDVSRPVTVLIENRALINVLAGWDVVSN